VPVICPGDNCNSLLKVASLRFKSDFLLNTYIHDNESASEGNMYDAVGLKVIGSPLIDHRQMEQRYFAIWIELQCGLEQVFPLARVVHSHVDEPVVEDEASSMYAVSAVPKSICS